MAGTQKIYQKEVRLGEGGSVGRLLQEHRQELRAAWTEILGVEIQKSRQIKEFIQKLKQVVEQMESP